MPVLPKLDWGARALWQQLDPLLPGLTVEVLGRTQSTNTVLLDRARTGPDAARDATGGDAGVSVRRSVESAAFGQRAIDLQPGLLVAEQQLAGRGRMGRAWQSAAGASLTFSLAMPLETADWSGLSLAVGVALCEALDGAPPQPRTAHRVGLKWPNDLWLLDPAGSPQPRTGRKLGGILIETVAAGPKRLAIVGIGLNVQPFETDVDAVTTGFGSLSELDADATAPAVLARIALPLVQAMQRFEREGFEAFADGFARRDVLRGLRITTTHADLPEGLACGVSRQGALQVRAADGVMAQVSSGEVSVRLARA